MSTRLAPRIIVHIDRVALRGYSPHERAAIVAGLRDQLTTRFATDARALQTGGDRSVRTLRGTSMATDSGGAAVGAGVADSVMGWLRS